MFDIKGRKVASKLKKTSVLLADEKIAEHIPETRKFTPASLEEMLDRYGTVVIKPVVGSGGHGLIKISKIGNEYTYKHGQKNRKFSDWDELLEKINKTRKKRKYLIQQGIELATIKGRPIDYRFKIQKPKKKWIITGMVGRLARRGYFITNLCKGGKRLTFTQGVKRSLPSANVKKLKAEMRAMTRRCTKLLEKKYPGIRKLGFDYGLDTNGHVWIFEVNTDPS